MASLQEIHGIVQKLGDHNFERAICIKAIAEQSGKSVEKITAQLRQLADLGYITFLRNRDFVKLTENGLLTRPLDHINQHMEAGF